VADITLRIAWMGGAPTLGLVRALAAVGAMTLGFALAAMGVVGD
jgi:hypothetical protein